MQTIEVDETGAAGHVGDDIAHDIATLTDTDLLRLKAIARLRARGLPGIEWTDILNETIFRLLNGSRRRPEGVALVATVAMTMRSIADEHWRVVRRERPVLVAADETALDQADESSEANPERAAAAAQALAGLDRLFAQDAVVLNIMAGLAEGLSATEIRLRYALTETVYDSARRRLRRALLRSNPEAPAP